MQIIGFSFEKILAERKKNPQGKIEIKSNINLKDVKEEKVSLIKDKDVLRFTFEFSIIYAPDIAEIKFQGFILGIVEKEKFKETIKNWKTKKIPDDLRLPIFNLILTKCNLKALQFEEEFGLPTHVPLPKISPPQDKSYVQ
jgi:hypothetical protein